MLVAAQVIHGSSIEGTDGNVGTVKDLLFDEETWVIRYLDVDTGHWLPGRRVLLSPGIVGRVGWPSQRLSVPLTQQQVKDSPPVDEDLPVSRRKEIELSQYYGWGVYWAVRTEEPIKIEGNPHLRSTKAVTRYHIQAVDGEIGHVADFIVDDEVWKIRYLVVDTRNWWMPGKHVLIAPSWAESIDWSSRKVHVGLDRSLIERSPEYDPAAPVNREYEEVLYDFHARPKYWLESAVK
jgi:hypothetical protein